MADGIRCPRCGYEMEVIKTVRYTGRIYRRRVCRVCGWRVSTDEVVREEKTVKRGQEKA